MPGMVAPVADECAQLLAVLAQQRHQLRLTAYGLDDDQARVTQTPSALSVGGLIKHVTSVESGWIDTVLRHTPDVAAAENDYETNFSMHPDETLADVLAGYEVVARRTEAVIATIPDLLQPVPVPTGVPWFPDDIDAWTVRWVLLHLIQETARHTGHADIIREMIDGATAFPLMAAAEGWPTTPWMQPWTPETPVTG
ncbi:MAG: DinB family protein [Acidimicrobiia bacterium]